jgi:flagellar FliJ protein
MTSRGPSNPNTPRAADNDSLHLLLEVAERQRDLVLARQNQARSALDAALGQAEQLRDYRSSCQDRWGQQFRQGAAITTVRVYHDFVARLHGAVDIQGRQVDRLRAELARSEAECLAAELRVASIDKLIARRVGDQQRKSDRREQKQQDEYAGRLAWQSSQGQGNGGALQFAALSASSSSGAYPGAPVVTDWARL